VLTRRIYDGLWAPAALRDAVHNIAGQFEAMDNAYLLARAEDIRAVGRRLLRHLMDCEDKGWQPPRKPYSWVKDSVSNASWRSPASDWEVCSARAGRRCPTD
jgi:signal transduction protein with GAF and PtsI domain